MYKELTESKARKDKHLLYKRFKGIFPVFFTFFTFFALSLQAQNTSVTVGAERTEIYFPLLKNKSIAVLGNQSSLIKNTHLVDSLISAGFNVKKVFCPEHGFRGTADAGEHVKNYTDKKTGLPVVSLYGKNKKPSALDLKGIDIVLFDLQDVGARFYTYISTMHYMMEACAENKVKLIILDRPNPNGFYVDGPVLEEKHKSFVGMHQVPVVHGMTVAEYAQMINGEGWLVNKVKCDLVCVSMAGYDHSTLYSLPVKPSPNLPNMTSIYLYPSLCFFEGTVISMGRGTDKPFRVFGHPKLQNTNYKFTPRSIEGASKNPPYNGEECKGFDVSEYDSMILKTPKLHLQWLLQAYKEMPDKTGFFNNFFNNLSGNATLKEQIVSGMNEDEIRKSWEPGLNEFKKVRKKYLLYKDFE